MYTKRIIKFFGYDIVFLLLLLLTSTIYPMTQSEAHLSVYYDLVQKWYNFNRNPFYKKIYDLTVAKEKQFNDTHYVFYNAFSNEWRVPQDLYLKMYERLHPLTVNIENFRAFRWIPIEHKTPKELIQEELKKHGLVNDRTWHLKIYLLSTNLALFGNTGFGGECTFEYFLHSRSNTPINDLIYQGILDIFDLPSNYQDNKTSPLYKYIPRIAKLADILQVNPLPNGKEPQSLAQIFIPKEIVNDIAYISWVQGSPYDPELAAWVLENAGQEKDGKIPGYQKIKESFEEIQQLFKDKQKGHPLFKKILENIERGATPISPLLDEYKRTPQLIEGLNSLQARLIISPKYVGNIGANVKVFTYDALTEQQRQAYESALNKLVDEIVSEFLKINAERSRDAAMPVTPRPTPRAIPSSPSTPRSQSSILPGAQRTREERERAFQRMLERSPQQ